MTEISTAIRCIKGTQRIKSSTFYKKPFWPPLISSQLSLGPNLTKLRLSYLFYHLIQTPTHPHIAWASYHIVCSTNTPRKVNLSNLKHNLSWYVRLTIRLHYFKIYPRWLAQYFLIFAIDHLIQYNYWWFVSSWLVFCFDSKIIWVLLKVVNYP